MATGLAALLLRWLSPIEAAACAAAAFLLCGILALVRSRRAGSVSEEEGRRGSSALLSYSFAVLGLILVFRGRLELAAAAWALTAFGDGMATVAGVTLRGPRLPWNPAKTWWGFLGFALYGTCTSALLIRWVQHGRAEGVGAIGASFLGSPSAPLWSDLTFLVLGCAAASVAAALAESLDAGVDDSLLVSVVGGAALHAATLVEPARLAALSDSLVSDLPRGAVAAGAAAAVLLLLRAARAPGAAWAWLLGTLLFWIGGWRPFLVLAVVGAIAVACARLAGEATVSPEGKERGRRLTGRAAAGAVAALLFALLAAATPRSGPFVVALVTALAATAAGSAAAAAVRRSGSRGAPVPETPGAPGRAWGGLSLGGTLAGIAVSAGIAAVAWAVSLTPPAGLWIVPAGTLAGLVLGPALGSARGGPPRPERELPGIVGILTAALSAAALASIARI